MPGSGTAARPPGDHSSLLEHSSSTLLAHNKLYPDRSRFAARSAEAFSRFLAILNCSARCLFASARARCASLRASGAGAGTSRSGVLSGGGGAATGDGTAGDGTGGPRGTGTGGPRRALAD